MKQRVRIPGLPLIGYILLTVIVFGPALFPDKGMMIFGDDIHHQYYFFREFFNHFFRSGIFPWWNPYLFGGQPYIADPMVNIWYPVNWLFIVLPLNVAYAWHIALHILWACLGIFFLLQRTIHASRYSKLAAWVAGVVFGFSGFFMARTWAGHVDVIAAASWMPWVVVAFYKLVCAESSASRRNPAHEFVIAAGVFAMQLLAGYQTMAFMTVIVVGFVTLLRSYSEKSWRPLFRAGLAGFAGLALAAIQLIPEQEFFRASIRTYRLPYSWVSYGSWTWASFLQLLNPFFFGNQYTYTGPPPNFIEHSAFVGVSGLILALIGLVYLGFKKRGSGKRVKSEDKTFFVLGWSFFISALFGLWMSLGSNAPIDLQYFFWKVIPMYRYLRIPPRHLVLVVFGLAGLTGIGITAIRQRWIQVGIALFVVGELVWFGRGFIEIKPIPESRHDATLIGLLRQDTQPYRVLQDFGVWLPERDAMDFDSVMSYGIFSATGYDTSMVRSYYEYVAKASGRKGSEAVLSHDVQVPYLAPESANAIDFLNIKYIMVPPLYDPFSGNPRYTLVREDAARDYRVYENTTVKPRFFLDYEQCGSVRVELYTPNVIRLSVDATCASMLMSSEVWYPGWKAAIDGKKVSIGKTYDTFRVLSIPAGKHTVIYEYQPTIFYVAAGVSVLTLMTLLLIVLRRRNP